VHFHDAELLWSLPVAKLLWPRAKLIYDVHEDFGNLMMIRDWLPKASRPAVRAVTQFCEKLLVRLTDGVVAVTGPLAAHFPFVPSVTVHNFATSAFFDQAAKWSRPPLEREFAIVHLGTLSPPRAKFLGAVLRHFHVLRPQMRSLVIGIEGDVVRAAAGGLPGQCEVVGKVPFDRVPELIGNAAVGIDIHPWLLPHLLPALAVKVCEYMACGCAVVASSMPVLDRMMKDSGLGPDSMVRIQGGRPEDYAQATVDLLDAMERGDDPGSRLRAFARQRMNWKGEAERLAIFYRGLLDEQPCAT
jgi:glycosyltransferase involved in cell wall biosynthesis